MPKLKHRSLLTYVGIFFALYFIVYFVWAAVRYPDAKREDEACDAIRKLGGEVIPWAQFIGEPGYRKIIAVRLTGPKIMDDDLELVRSLNGPGTVDLRDSQVTDAGLKHLIGLKRLHALILSGTKITDVGLETVSSVNGLVGLELERTPVTDAGLEHLRGLVALKWLYLRDTKVTEAGVKRLQQALPNCAIAWDPPTMDEQHIPKVSDQHR